MSGEQARLDKLVDECGLHAINIINYQDDLVAEPERAMEIDTPLARERSQFLTKYMEVIELDGRIKIAEAKAGRHQQLGTSWEKVKLDEALGVMRSLSSG